MDRGAWWATVHGVAKSRTRLSDFTLTFHFHALEREMATHSSVLAWRIPGTGEPGGLLSMGLHRVGHDWSDLAAAAASLYRKVTSKMQKCLFITYDRMQCNTIMTNFHVFIWTRKEQAVTPESLISNFSCILDLISFWISFFFRDHVPCLSCCHPWSSLQHFRKTFFNLLLSWIISSLSINLSCWQH